MTLNSKVDSLQSPRFSGIKTFMRLPPFHGDLGARLCRHRGSVRYGLHLPRRGSIRAAIDP